MEEGLKTDKFEYHDELTATRVEIIASGGPNGPIQHFPEFSRNSTYEVANTTTSTVSLQLLPALEPEQNGSVLSSSTPRDCLTISSGGVEELQKFLNNFNSELAAESHQRGSLMVGSSCANTGAVSGSENSFAVANGATLVYEGGLTPMTPTTAAALEIVEFANSTSNTDDSFTYKEDSSEHQDGPRTDVFLMPPSSTEKYQHHSNGVVSANSSSSSGFGTASLVSGSENHAVTSQPTLVIQEHQLRPSQQHPQQQQLLIPVDCSNALGNGNQIAPGSTVLLPVVPTLLPDGTIEVRITGQAIALPSSISMNGPGSATGVSNEQLVALPVQHPQPQQQPQQQILIIMGGAQSNTVSVNETEKTAPVSKKAKTKKHESRRTGSTSGSGKKASAVTTEMVLSPCGSNAGGAGPTIIAAAVEENQENTVDGGNNVAGDIGEKRGDTLEKVRERLAAAAKQPPKRKVHHCEFCDYTNLKKYLLVRHMKSHSEDRPHVCHVCEKRFKTANSLQNHVNTHTGVRPHQCQLCKASFTTSGEMVRHVRYKHTQEKPHKCPNCDYASVELSKLKRHLRSHTGERPYQCSRCNYASPDMYKLKRHMRVHTGEKPYECDVCLQRFTQSNSLKAHKLIHCGNKPVYKCEFCSSSCGRKTDLKIHIQKLHTALERPLSCKKCGSSFPDRYSLKQHQRSHDGERCFSCTLCNYSAYTQRHLDTHMLVHRCEKPFECPIPSCTQMFRQKSQVKRHFQAKHGSIPMPNADGLVKKKSSFRKKLKGRLHEERRQQEEAESPPKTVSGPEQPAKSKPSMSCGAGFIESEDDESSDEEDDEDEEIDCKVVQTSRGSNGLYTCSSCGEGFRHLVQLEQHCQLEHIGAEIQ